jgi:hypothetical protein
MLTKAGSGSGKGIGTHSKCDEKPLKKVKQRTFHFQNIILDDL